jgi:hypothetical protein
LDASGWWWDLLRTGRSVVLLKVLYADGSEVHAGDRVLVNGERKAVVSAIVLPDTPNASDYALSDGGILVEFDNGELQAWPRVDGDMERITAESTCHELN